MLKGKTTIDSDDQPGKAALSMCDRLPMIALPGQQGDYWLFSNKYVYLGTSKLVYLLGSSKTGSRGPGSLDVGCLSPRTAKASMKEGTPPARRNLSKMHNKISKKESTITLLAERELAVNESLIDFWGGRKISSVRATIQADNAAEPDD